MAVLTFKAAAGDCRPSIRISPARTLICTAAASGSPLTEAWRISSQHTPITRIGGYFTCPGSRTAQNVKAALDEGVLCLLRDLLI
jgi:hypothetical protein